MITKSTLYLLYFTIFLKMEYLINTLNVLMKKKLERKKKLDVKKIEFLNFFLLINLNLDFLIIFQILN